MLDTAPTAALTSATNVWKVYYKELFEGAQAGSIRRTGARAMRMALSPSPTLAPRSPTAPPRRSPS